MTTKPSDTEWTLATLKEHFETILTERNTALDKADQHLADVLQDFPQAYSRKEDFVSLNEEINAIKIDHVQRREFDTLKNEQSQGRGMRLTLVATAGVMLALITVALGAMYANQLSHKDVSEQIKIESPWAQDKPGVEEDIHNLEQQVILLKTQLATHEATDRIRAEKK